MIMYLVNGKTMKYTIVLVLLFSLISFNLAESEIKTEESDEKGDIILDIFSNQMAHTTQFPPGRFKLKLKIHRIFNSKHV